MSKRYNILENGVVVNTIVATPEFMAARYSEAQYQEAGDTVTAVAQPRYITKLAFRNRFTTPEKVAIEMAALDDPSLSLDQRVQRATLRAYMKDLEAATYVDLDREDTRNGVIALEQMGILGEGRSNNILDDEVEPHERPLL